MRCADYSNLLQFILDFWPLVLINNEQHLAIYTVLLVIYQGPVPQQKRVKKDLAHYATRLTNRGI